MHVDPVVLRRLCFFGGLYSLWVLQFFCLLFSRVAWGKGFDGEILFRTVSQGISLSAHCATMGLWFIPIYCRRKLFDEGVTKHWSLSIEEYQKLFCCYVPLRTVVFGFLLSSWPVYSQVLWHPNSVQDGFYLREWALDKSDIGWLVLQFRIIIALVYLACRTPL